MNERVLPASAGQRLMWFLEHYRGGSSSVNCPAGFRIRGPLGRDDALRAVVALLQRHEALRTTLHRDGRDLLQRVHPAPAGADAEVADRLAFTDLGDVPPGEREAEVERRYAAELSAPLDVTATAVRWHLFRVDPTDHVLCANMHHLVSDAWSCGVVIDDVIALLGGRRAPRPVQWQYADFARWQHDRFAAGELDSHQAYWATQLDGMQLPALPARHGASDDTAHPALVSRLLDRPTSDGLRTLAKAERSTLFAVMLCLYYLLLLEQTGQTDLVVASLFANRTRPEVGSTVGFFANMILLRTRLAAEGSFRDALRATSRTVTGAVVHQAVPYQMISVPALRTARGRANDVVFQMLPDRDPASWSPTDAGRGLVVDTFRPRQGLSRFGLNLTVIPQDDRFDVRLSYARDQFDDAWARAFVERYAQLAAAVLADAGARVGHLVHAA